MAAAPTPAPASLLHRLVLLLDVGAAKAFGELLRQCHVEGAFALAYRRSGVGGAFEPALRWQAGVERGRFVCSGGSDAVDDLGGQVGQRLEEVVQFRADVRSDGAAYEAGNVDVLSVENMAVDVDAQRQVLTVAAVMGDRQARRPSSPRRRVDATGRQAAAGSDDRRHRGRTEKEEPTAAVDVRSRSDRRAGVGCCPSWCHAIDVGGGPGDDPRMSRASLLSHLPPLLGYHAVLRSLSCLPYRRKYP